jgi:hypothetical protein
MGYSRSFYIAQVSNCGSFYPGFIKHRGFWPQHRKAVCWLLLKTANKGLFSIRTPYIFYTACKRTFFISKFDLLLQDTLSISRCRCQFFKPYPEERGAVQGIYLFFASKDRMFYSTDQYFKL